MFQLNDTTELIRSVGNALIDNYSQGQPVVGGINGPYDDPETNIRNLSHLAVICGIEIIKFQKTELIPVLKRIGNDILAEQGNNGLWVMRRKATKDTCNGVIGHAWLIEGLLYIYKVLRDEIYITKAMEVARQHGFEPGVGLWERPTGEGIDYTLNHQLWYAASLAELNEYVKVESFENQIYRFLECLTKNFSINKMGRIRHNTIMHRKKIDTIKQLIKNYNYDCNEKHYKPSMAYKEEGYHSFNLMALTRLYRIKGSDNFFSTNGFSSSIQYLKTDHFFDGLNSNRVDLDISLNNSITDCNEKSINIYGYPYNVPGFELPYISTVFPELHLNAVMEECLMNQVNYTYDPKVCLFGKDCHDKQTINYRVYEYYRFLEIEK